MKNGKSEVEPMTCKIIVIKVPIRAINVQIPSRYVKKWGNRFSSLKDFFLEIFDTPNHPGFFRNLGTILRKPFLFSAARQDNRDEG